jgi:hypothetical protein
MIMVPGSMPKMIFDAFCKVQLIFTDKFFLEQKYQINNQLPDWPFALCIACMEFIQPGHSSARPGNALAAGKTKLATVPFLDRFPADVRKLGY